MSRGRYTSLSTERIAPRWAGSQRAMMSPNPLPSGSLPAGQGHMREQFIGDGQRHTFDLREVPSSIPAMTARVSKPLHSIALIIGNLRLETFAAGYDVLVDRVGKRIYL